MNSKATLTALRTGWHLLLLGGLIAAAVVIVLSKSAQPVYEASASFVVSPGADIALDDVAQGVNTLEASRSRSLMTTLTQITDSDGVILEAMTTLGLDPSVAETYDIKSIVVPEANVMETVVIGPDPEIAAALASTVGEIGGTRFVALYQIYAVGSLDAASVPTAPSNPSLAKLLIIAVAIGLMVGGGAALLRAAWVHRSDRTMERRLGAYDRTVTPIRGRDRFKKVG